MENSRPELDQKGLAPHGATWGERGSVTLRATSRGPGVPVQVQHPRGGGPPRRVLSGDGTAHMTGGKLFITPRVAAAGTEFVVVIEA